jgi:hypothetical protein
MFKGLVPAAFALVIATSVAHLTQINKVAGFAVPAHVLFVLKDVVATAALVTIYLKSKRLVALLPLVILAYCVVVVGSEPKPEFTGRGAAWATWNGAALGVLGMSL